MQPHIANGTSNGHVVIDIVKDADAKDWPSIVLDINNITITKAQGKHGTSLDIRFDLLSASHINDNRKWSTDE